MMAGRKRKKSLCLRLFPFEVKCLPLARQIEFDTRNYIRFQPHAKRHMIWIVVGVGAAKRRLLRTRFRNPRWKVSRYTIHVWIDMIEIKQSGLLCVARVLT